MKKTEQGYAVVWILVTIALIAVAITSIEFTVEDRPKNTAMFVVFGISALIAAFGLFVEAKRDLYSFSAGGILFGSIAAMITGAVAVFGTDPHPVAATVAVITTLAVVGCIAVMFKTQYGHDPLRNILREEFNRAAIHEVDGVQFVATSSEANLLAGEGFEIRVIVQNGWETERTFEVGMKPETRISLNSAGLVFDKDAKIALPGGAAGVISIPVLAEAKAKGNYSLSVSPKVTGSGGIRVRKWRAKTMSSQVPGWVTALGALGGFLVWGGGMKFKATVRKNKEIGDEAITALPAETEIIWEPEAHDLRAAVPPE